MTSEDASNIAFLEKDLKRFLIRESITPQEVTELEALTEYRQYSAGDIILEEGAVNDRLYFLVDGEVQVIQKDEVIATLTSPGDVLGEMSIITKKKCSASNRASKQSTLLCLEVEKISLLSERLQNLFSTAMNQLFAVILAKKLAITNAKARLFEITNRELQVAKRALEVASSNKIEEMSSNQRGVFEKITTLLKDEIHPIRDQLASTGGEIFNRVEKVSQELEKFSKDFASSNDLRNTRVLVVESEINEQINAKMSLGGTGVNFKVVSDLESAHEAIKAEKFNIICITHAFVELISFARGLGSECIFVFMSSEPISKHFSTLKQYPDLTTILARHPDDRVFTVKNISTTIRKLSSHDLFGMDKYLSWGTEVTELSIKSSNQREELIGKIEEFLISIDIRSGLRNKVARVTEELLMNAIYDAPTDADGKSLYNHLERTTPVQLKPTEYAKLRYACDGALLAISVIDHFGALTRSTILSSLERCFNTESIGSYIEGKGGGGNGLFQIIQSSSLTIFNVQPKKKTEVIALFNINHQMQKISLHPSFHFFEALP